MNGIPEGLTNAQMKAYRLGGTNNVVVGRSLVRKGLFQEVTKTGTLLSFRFMTKPEEIQRYESARKSSDRR